MYAERGMGTSPQMEFFPSPRLFEELTQEEAAKRMGISRGTLWRSLYSARKKIATALAEMRPLIIG